ncbi:MAG: transketolase C-terminal domain-containing protein [Candidatus Paceibacterota bacterium]
MGKTVAETIKEISCRHLTENNGLILGQALTAVGWVNNTVPDCPGIIELSMADVAGSGIAVGAALAGRRPILILRFQDFLFLNGSLIVNYAAKTKEFFGKGTPIFVRLIAVEGKGFGPVHSGKLHSIFMHFPGLRVCSPMTPKEYEECWEVFMNNDDPMIVSEHRCSFNNAEEMSDVIRDDAEITIYAISAARFNVSKAAEILAQNGLKCNIIHISWLKPFFLTEKLLTPLRKSKVGIVVDSGFEMAGASQSIAYELMFKTGVPVRALGIYDKSVGVTPETENLTPDAERIAKVSEELYEEKIKGKVKNA